MAHNESSFWASLGWTEWLAHSNFSFLMGASHPHELYDRAAELGYNGLGLADMDGVYGSARFWRSGRGNRLRQFYGAEVHLAKDHDQPLLLQNTIALYALNLTGWHQLCSLLTTAHRHGKRDAFLTMRELLRSPTSHLVAILPMRGYLRAPQEEAWSYALLKETFDDRIFQAVSRHLHPAEDGWITKAFELSQQYNIPWLPSQDSWMHSSQRKPLSDLLHAIRKNLPLDQAVPHFFPNAMRCLHPLPTLERLYGPLPGIHQALERSAQLAANFDLNLKELRYHYPKEMLPVGFTPQSFLEHLTEKGTHERFSEGIPPKVAQALKHELQLIEQLEFADYFLTVWDIVCWARRRGILCQGRGSAANSAVCFVLGITAIDPARFELLFERFISVERGDPPDIDVDFEHERREEVIHYIYEHYGRDRAAMVANVITFRKKGALRFVGKALGISENTLSQCTTLLRSRRFRGLKPQETLAELQEHNLKEELPPHSWALWGKFSSQLVGFPRHLGIHSGGFLLSDRSITHLCHHEPATMPGRSVVAWCKEDIEALGFFKIDVLALGMLTAIRKSFDMIKLHDKKSLSLEALPESDPATWDMICKADTVGVFQIESRAQMSMLPRLKPRCFYDLVVEVAIIRPGPIQGGMIHPYLKRRSGQEPVSFPDPRLEPILQRTYGVPIFQEQVMRVAIAVGGFSAGEADELRRQIGSFAMKNRSEEWIEKLRQGMARNHIAPQFIDSIIGQIRGFSSYGFPESHAASFALLAWASCWLKRHHPAAFFAGVLNSHPMGFYSTDVLLRTARRDGVAILPICVNASDWDHTLERQPDHSLALRMGLRIVRGLSETGGRRLVERRQDQQNLDDFLRHVRLSRVDLTALAAADAFSNYDIPRRQAIWLAEVAPFDALLEDTEVPPDFQAETDFEKVQLDYHTQGTSHLLHPAEVVRRESWHYPMPPEQLTHSWQLPKLPAGRIVRVFGLVSCRQAPPTAKGVMFITLWDERGAFDIVVKPEVRKRFQKAIEAFAFLCVEARVQRSEGAQSLLLTKVILPEGQNAKISHIKTSLPERQSVFHRARNYM